jgi:hypothetical protein
LIFVAGSLRGFLPSVVGYAFSDTAWANDHKPICGISAILTYDIEVGILLVILQRIDIAQYQYGLIASIVDALDLGPNFESNCHAYAHIHWPDMPGSFGADHTSSICSCQALLLVLPSLPETRDA